MMQLDMGLALRDEAIDRTERANEAWITRGIELVRNLARMQPYMTTDDVWKYVEDPDEPRAMGALMRRAKSDGLITPTNLTQPSHRAQCHGRPVRVWRSQLRKA